LNSKKHYLVYQITNLINGKIYIGIHSTENIEDGYMGSGTYIKQAIKKHGIENFKKDILFDFDNPEEMVEKEIELVTEQFAKLKSTYNAIPGGHPGGNIGPKISLRGKINVKDSKGNILKVNKTDPRYLSGELTVFSKGMITVKDPNGKTFRVPKDDPRWLSGELVGIRKGVPLHENTLKSVSIKGKHKHSDESKEKISIANTGKKRSEEQCLQNSLRQIGKKLSQEHKDQIRESNLGKKNTPEHNEKIRQAHIGTSKPRVSNQMKAVWMLRRAELSNPDSPLRGGYVTLKHDNGINFTFHSIYDASHLLNIRKQTIEHHIINGKPISRGNGKGFKCFCTKEL